MERQDGYALPVTLTIMSISLILILSTSVSMMYDRANAANDRSATQAEEVAKAGFTKYKTAAFQTFRYYVTHPEQYATPASRSAQCGNLLSIGLDLGRDGIGIGVGGVTGDSNDLVNNGFKEGTVAVGSATGTYKVSYYVSGSGIVLKSEGKVNGAKAVVQAFLSGQNSSAFSNAIFAGASGQLGKHLNGSADVYGSVYVEGSPSEPDAISTNGKFGFHNHYSQDTLSEISGVPKASLAKFLKLEALEQTDMCATVRAKHGKLSFDASSTVGEAEPSTPDGFTRKMKGVYAGQPDSSGSYNVADYISGSNVFAETKGQFDLVPPPTLPKLDQTGIVDLTKLPANVRAAVGSNPTWKQTVQQDALLNGVVVSKNGTGVTTQPTDIGCNVSSAIDSKTGELVFGSNAITCQNSAGRGFTYKQEVIDGIQSWVLDINGTLDIKGLNVTFDQNIIVRYDGKASMMVEKVDGVGGDVTINGDVMPKESFPDKSVLGIIAENDLNITGLNQNKIEMTKRQIVTGLFYAGNNITAVKDSVVMGTLMGDGFDLSNGKNGGSAKTQVLQVPGLEYNLPPGFASLNNTSVPSFAVYSYERK